MDAALTFMKVLMPAKCEISLAQCGSSPHEAVRFVLVQSLVRRSRLLMDAALTFMKVLMPAKCEISLAQCGSSPHEAVRFVLALLDETDARTIHHRLHLQCILASNLRGSAIANETHTT
jgi:hypothetical protein